MKWREYTEPHPKPENGGVIIVASCEDDYTFGLCWKVRVDVQVCRGDLWFELPKLPRIKSREGERP
jgi:hypothetical protein